MLTIFLRKDNKIPEKFEALWYLELFYTDRLRSFKELVDYKSID